MIALVMALALGAPQEGDYFEWARRLDELDLTWKWGEFEFEASGELDFEFFAFPHEAPGVSVEEAALRARHYDETHEADSPELGGRFSIFLDGFRGEWLTWSIEARTDLGSPAEHGESLDARMEQYWARLTIPGEAWANLQVGKFAAPFGNFIPRHYPKANPLTTYPLPYDHVTTFLGPSDATATVLGRREKDEVKTWRVPIFQAVYATGAMAFGRVGPLDYAVAVMNMAPAAWAWDWSLRGRDLDYPTLVGRVGWTPDISTKVGASWAKGAIDRHDVAGVPQGREVGDFPQTMAGMDFEYSRGDLDFFGEVVWSRFEAPLVEDMDFWSAYVEGKYTFLPGLFGAARAGFMRFGEIHDAAGRMRSWDYDTGRLELGGGYFFTRNFFVKATGQWNHTLGGADEDDPLFMMQVGLGF